MFDKDRQIEYYEKLLAVHGDNFLSLDWKSPDSQNIRFWIFADLMRMFGNEKYSVLDLGCGFGDLYKYLSDNKIQFTYTGIDIAPKILETAQKKYPDAHFEVKDILENKPDKKYDFVFCSGALNICLGDGGEHLQYMKAMIVRMFELCNLAVGVNFLSTQAKYYLKEEDLSFKQYFYTKPEDVVSWAKGLTDRFILRHDYHVGDFTAYLLK